MLNRFNKNIFKLSIFKWS